MKAIFLIGYMGSGKTTLGRTLSAMAGLDFIDLDIYIEGRYHKTVKEIFATKGEEGFRKIERNMLHEVSDFENVIIACGGGTPCHYDNMDYMSAHGTTVYLDVSVPRLVERLTLPGCKGKRPLIANMTDEELSEYVIEMLSGRKAYYEKADVTFDASKLESEEQIKASTMRLRQVLGL